MGSSQSSGNTSNKLQRRRRHDSLQFPGAAGSCTTSSSLRKRMGSLLGGESVAGKSQLSARQQVGQPQTTQHCNKQLSHLTKLSNDQRIHCATGTTVDQHKAPVPVGGGWAANESKNGGNNNYVSMAARTGAHCLLWKEEQALINHHHNHHHQQQPPPTTTTTTDMNHSSANRQASSSRKPLHQLDQQLVRNSQKPALVETSLDKAAGSSQLNCAGWRLMGEPADSPATCCGVAALVAASSPAFQLGKAVNSKTGSVLNSSQPTGVANGAAARQLGACDPPASLHLSTVPRHFYPQQQQQQQQLQHQQPPTHNQVRLSQLEPHQEPFVVDADSNSSAPPYQHNSPLLYSTLEAPVDTADTTTAAITTACRHSYLNPGSGGRAEPGNQLHQLLHWGHEYAAPTPPVAGQHWYASRTLEAPGRRAKKKSQQCNSKPLIQSLFSDTQNNNNHNNTSTRNHRSAQQRSGANTIHLASANYNNNNNNKHLLTSGARSQRPVSSSGSLKRLKSGPLKARQASQEAMRTIDMYLVRQVAHACMDHEMERKIDLEIRLRELAAQSMLEARTELDVLEVEKSLLASDQRMNCYALQLERQRKQLSNPSLSTDSGRGSKSGGYLIHPHQLTTTTTTTTTTSPTVVRPDVIGAPQVAHSGHCEHPASTSSAANSPSFSATDSMSPSKLSPVSGESANSPASFVSSPRGSRGSRWRTGQRARTSSRSSADQLTNEQRARNKRRQQLLQSIATQSNINCNMVLQSKASLSLSELRIPLMWRDVDHFKQKGDYKRYAVFCLLRIGSQIYDTQLISDVDRQVTDVTFDDVIVFNEVDSDFELTLEVYSCVYLEQFSFGYTPRKLKDKLTSSVSRAMGRRLATQTASTNYTKQLQAYQDKSYRFAMIASALLKLEHASNSVKTYDLVLVSPSAHNRQHLGTGSPLLDSLLASRHHNVTSLTVAHKDAQKNTLPLFGHFCCRLAVRPDVFDKNIRSGYLRVATISMPNQQHSVPSSESTLASSGLGSANNSPRNSSSDSASSTMEARGGAKLQFSSAESVASKLKASKMASMSMSSSQLYWAVLRNFTLQLWPVDERKLQSALTKNQLPILPEQPLSFNIDKRTRLLRVSNSSITLETDNACLVMTVYSMMSHHHHQHSSAHHATSEETGLWLRCLEQYIYDSHIWDNVLNRHQHHQQQQQNNHY